jgi:hypothetical protein
MNIFDRIFNTQSGRIMISIIWGLGLALLFSYQMCDGPQCVVFKAPPSDINNNIYLHDSSCYSFVPYSVACDPNGCPIKSNPSKNDKGGKCNASSNNKGIISSQITSTPLQLQKVSSESNF